MLQIQASKLLTLFILCLCLFISPSGTKAQRRISPEPQKPGAAQDSSAAGSQRIRPREGLGCDINETTSFTGRVISYARTARRIFVRVRTDEATTEQFTITLARRADAAQRFLFKGERFRPEDWKKIETRGGSLRQGMRATIWACYVRNEPKAKIIDWQPRETETRSVY